jgi:anaerobic ribonucleoside-triphosphate reductase activating protein
VARRAAGRGGRAHDLRRRAAGAAARDALRTEADILVYTGHHTGTALRRGRRVLASADAVVTGRYEQGRPTGLIWRGSANQELIPLTARGAARYEGYLDLVPDRPPLQVVPGPALIGVPRGGDLDRLRAALADHHLVLGGASWHPTPP